MKWYILVLTSFIVISCTRKQDDSILTDRVYGACLGMANNMMGNRKGKVDTLKKMNPQAYAVVKDKWVFSKEANLAFEKYFAKSVEIEKITNPAKRSTENKKNGLEFVKALENSAPGFWSDCTGTIKPALEKCLALSDNSPEGPNFSNCVDNSFKSIGLVALVVRHNKFTEAYKKAIEILQSGSMEEGGK